MVSSSSSTTLTIQAPTNCSIKQCCYVNPYNNNIQCDSTTLVFDIIPNSTPPQPDVHRAQFFCPIHNKRARSVYSQYKSANKYYTASQLAKTTSTTSIQAITAKSQSQSAVHLLQASWGRSYYAQRFCPNGQWTCPNP